MLDHVGSVADWALEQFGMVDLGDVRRSRRLVSVAVALASFPGRSLPQLFDGWYDLKACYELFKRKEASLDRIESGHWDLVAQSCRESGTYLFVEDTTYLDYTSHDSVSGLGRIGDDGGHGFVQHTTLALREHTRAGALEPDFLVVGLAHQKLWKREGPARKGRESFSDRLQRPRESLVWSESLSAIGPAPRDESVTWVMVGDRGADVIETLEGCRAQGFDFLIRACQDRAVYVRYDGEADDPSPAAANDHLFSVARAVEVTGSYVANLRARPGQPARQAHLQFGARLVRVRPPWRPGKGLGKGVWPRAWVIRVWETDAPEGVRPLEWILLTSLPVSDFDDVYLAISYYEARWFIEDYHKCMKTGLRVESHQLKTADRLESLIALVAVVAVRLLALQQAARVHPEAPASESGLSSLELDLVHRWYCRRHRVDTWNLGTLAKALGKLGGHIGRRSDGPPGWQCLWKGWLRLQNMALGAELLDHEFG